MKMSFQIKQIAEKDAIVYRNVLGAFAIKGLSLFLSLFTLPAYMRFFQDQRVLGVWYTVLSVVTWVLNFDLGIGNGLRNRLSEALARKNTAEAKAYISSAYWIIGKVVLVLTALGLLVIPQCNWNRLFNVPPELISADTLTWVVQCTFLAIALQFFLRLISSVLYAMQKSAINHVISLCTTLLMLVLLWLMPQYGPEKSLKLFSLSYLFFSNAPLAAATVILFCGPLRDCRPRRGSISREKAKSVMSLGGLFFACQITYMLIANTNEFFISQYTGPENVVEYQIYYRLFGLGGMLFSLALTPIWSVVSRAIAEKDFLWLRGLYKKLRRLTWAGVLAEFLLIGFLQLFIDLWLGQKAIRVNYIYAMVFASFGAVMLFQSTFSAIANGIGAVKLQAICYAAGFCVKLLIIPAGCRLYPSWVIVVAANVLVLIPYCFLQKRQLDKLLTDSM